MTFFKSLMRILAAALASVALMVIPQIIAFFQGAPPSDVSPILWGIAGTVGVFLLNWLLGKIPRPVAAEPEPPSASRSRPGHL